MGGVTGDVNGSLVIFGDIIWVKLHEDSWWPAQVCENITFQIQIQIHINCVNKLT